MRGKVKVSWYLCSFAGITPAYAGKRAVPFYYYVGGQDHPRVCGEKEKLQQT